MTYPLRGVQYYVRGLTTPQAAWNVARDRQSKLYDTTATASTRKLASFLISGLTPANSQWFSMTVSDQTNEEREWLERSCFLTWKNIHASNYSEVAFEGFIDAVITGMFAIFIRSGVDRPFEFSLWPMSNLFVAESRSNGGIDTAFYEFALTKVQARAEYGNQACKHLSDKGGEDELSEYVQAIYPREVTDIMNPLPIASVHVCKKCKCVVKESGFEEMPLIVPRIMTIPGGVYSHGLVYEALPTIRSLNKLQETILGAADMSVAGMWGAVDDGVLNPRTVTVGPRKIVTVASKDSIFPLMPGSDFQIAQWMVADMQAAIKSILLTDTLAGQEGPNMTATEVNARMSLMRQTHAPNYERLQDEFLRPLVNRCFGILFRDGVFGNPPESLLGRLTHMTYLSPLARAQQMEEMQAMERYEVSLSQMSQLGHVEALDWYDWDSASKRKAELLNVPAAQMLTSDEVQKVRVAKQEVQQAQQQQAMVQEQISNGQSPTV
jgi:hypothetical protein